MIEAINTTNSQWLNLITNNSDGGDILQSAEFGESKTANGWRGLKFKFSSEEYLNYFLVLEKKTLLGKIWYIPKGPGITDVAVLSEFISEIKDYAAKRGVIFIKIEPPIDAKLAPEIEKLKLNISRTKNIQPNSSTVIVDLKPEVDDILASFKQRTRRSIRKAEKSGVVVEAVEPNEANLKKFYNLYSLTGERAGFFIRPLGYYLRFWHIFGSSKMANLYFAKTGSGIVAAAMVLHGSSKALYKDGASDRNIMPEGSPYLLQWEIIKDLKARGIKEYDLHGTPPEDELDDKSHPFYSLGVFKTAFSDKVPSTVGAYDIIVNDRKYKLWQKFGLRAYQAWAHRIKKSTFY